MSAHTWRQGVCRRCGVHTRWPEPDSSTCPAWWAGARVLGCLLRAARVRSGMGRAELAARVGSHPPIVSRVERGHHTPELPTLLRYCRALDLDIERVVAVAEAVSVPGVKRGRWAA